MANNPQQPQNTGNVVPATQSEEIRISDLILNVRSYFQYLLKRWWIIVTVGLLSGVLGFVYAFFQDEDYITESTWIIDSEAGSGGFMSSLMGLASAIGIGGGSSSEGFTNELLGGIIQSRRVIKGAMLEENMIDGSYDKMAHHFMRLYPDFTDEYHLEGYRFKSDSLPRITAAEDSVLEFFYKKILEKHMDVTFDEGTALNKLTVRSLSRDFSVELSSWMLADASNFFIESAVQKEAQSLAIAQRQSDSLMGVLRAKEALLARLTDEQGYNFKAQNLLEEGRLLRDVEVMSTMYAESYASMQMAYNSLQDKKPIIQVIDKPQFSTAREDIKLVLFAILGLVLGAFLCIIFFILRKLVGDILAEEATEVLPEAAAVSA